ncbi:MAG: NmrA family NAD(P)-binding protein [Myxococcales bacterium]
MFVVAGVTGHVGSVVAKTLLEQKKPVRVIVRDAAKGKEWSQKGAEVAVGSLDDVRFLTQALKGKGGFFALLPPNYQAKDFIEAQYAAADAIAAAVKASGVPHVVLLSSIGADLPAGTGPIKALHRLEEKLRASGAKMSALRASYFQENAGSAVAPAKEAGIFPNFGNADYPFPMIATKDIGAAAVEALLHPPAKSEVIDVTGPAYSYRQVAEKLGKALGKTLRIVDIPPAQHVEALTKAGLSPSLAKEFAEMYAAFNAGKATPKGDRAVQGKTGLDETIRGLVGGA